MDSLEQVIEVKQLRKKSGNKMKQDQDVKFNQPDSNELCSARLQETKPGEDRKEEIRDLEYYKKAYEEECYKNVLLGGRLSDAMAQVESKEFQLNRIKNNPLWKASKPLRATMHWGIRQKNRIRNLGGVRGAMRKLSSKKIELNARKQHGTASFPDAAERERQEQMAFSKDITFSILVPLYNTPESFLRDMIGSVQAQTYSKWELCLADGSDPEHASVGEICKEYAREDARIKYRHLEKNLGISGNTNACCAMATGNYIGLFDHDDVLHPSVLFYYMEAICEKDADYIYCDECTFQGNSIDNMITLHFKPDYSPDNLCANNYICHFSVFSRQLLERLIAEEKTDAEGNPVLFRTRFDGSQDHDMILRLTARAKHIVHVPKLLYYWRSHKGSVAADINAKSYAIDAAKGAVADYLRYKGLDHFEIESTRAFETIFRIKYPIPSREKVSIIIANKDHEADLRRVISSVLEKTTYDNYEIIVVENNSTEPRIFAYYEELKAHPRIKVVTYEGEFNYSKINNLGAANAEGAYLLLLNNDTQVITVNWLEEMMMYAQRADVGAVGAKLYYPDYTIQHAGIVLGLGAHRTAGHSHYKVNRENLGYMGRLCYAQNVSAVTGACLMVRKELFEEVGGLNEELAVALNDVDFCLKLREKGYWNVWTPFAELFHFESNSRGLDYDGVRAKRYQKECDLFRERWGKVIDAGDPFYNVNFSLDRSDYSLKIFSAES